MWNNLGSKFTVWKRISIIFLSVCPTLQNQSMQELVVIFVLIGLWYFTWMQCYQIWNKDDRPENSNCVRVSADSDNCALIFFTLQNQLKINWIERSAEPTQPNFNFDGYAPKRWSDKDENILTESAESSTTASPKLRNDFDSARVEAVSRVSCCLLAFEMHNHFFRNVEHFQTKQLGGTKPNALNITKQSSTTSVCVFEHFLFGKKRTASGYKNHIDRYQTYENKAQLHSIIFVTTPGEPMMSMCFLVVNFHCANHSWKCTFRFC